MRTNPINCQNIVRIADINASELSDALLSFFDHLRPTYRDQVLTKHLYSEDNVLEGVCHPIKGCEPLNADELIAVKEVFDKQDCSYIPIIFT